MSQTNVIQTFLATSDLTRQSQEVLRRLLEELDHLDLTGKLSSEDGIVQVAHGGNGDIHVAFCWIGETKVKVALKRLRFYIYKNKDIAKVRSPLCTDYSTLRFTVAFSFSRRKYASGPNSVIRMFFSS